MGRVNAPKVDVPRHTYFLARLGNAPPSYSKRSSMIFAVCFDSSGILGKVDICTWPPSCLVGYRVTSKKSSTWMRIVQLVQRNSSVPQSVCWQIRRPARTPIERRSNAMGDKWFNVHGCGDIASSIARLDQLQTCERNRRTAWRISVKMASKTISCDMFAPEPSLPSQGRLPLAIPAEAITIASLQDVQEGLGT